GDGDPGASDLDLDVLRRSFEGSHGYEGCGEARGSRGDRVFAVGNIELDPAAWTGGGDRGRVFALGWHQGDQGSRHWRALALAADAAHDDTAGLRRRRRRRRARHRWGRWCVCDGRFAAARSKTYDEKPMASVHLASPFNELSMSARASRVPG